MCPDPRAVLLLVDLHDMDRTVIAPGFEYLAKGPAEVEVVVREPVGELRNGLTYGDRCVGNVARSTGLIRCRFGRTEQEGS